MRSWLRARFRAGGRACRGTGLLCVATVAWTGPATAEPIHAVVELFTSQGCGSCRTAEPVIRDIARQSGVVALTLPVTYWDYLGWKDTLALHAFTERQRAYARLQGGRQVFTPQAVVDGTAMTVGSDRTALERLIREAAPRDGLPVPVRGETRGDRIVVDVGAAPDAAEGEMRGAVWLVPVIHSRAVPIRAGENGGRTVTYLNVARALQRLGSWTGQAAHYEVPRASAAVAGADGWVVLVQGGVDGAPGRILGAAKGPGL